MIKLDLYRYSDVCEGAVANERFATLLGGWSSRRGGKEVFRVDMNQLAIAVVGEEES